jgi:hypothetical protein
MNKLLTVSAFLPCIAIYNDLPPVNIADGAGQGSVIISEIMADPLPQVGLPPFEYIEILNTSSDTLELVNWTFTHNTSTVTIPVVKMAPGGYLILCGTGAESEMIRFGPALGIKSFPTITDRSAVLVLRDSNGTLVHGVEYSDKWHSNPLKGDGGWSLEIVDTHYPFFSEGNWESSKSRSGGTPGAVNSVSAANPDLIRPEIVNVFPADSISVMITFNKSISSSWSAPSVLDPGAITLIDFTATDPLRRSFRLALPDPIKKGVVYSITPPSDLRCFNGNEVIVKPYRFALPDIARDGDLMFNEILFDPWPDEYDFVELVNVSDRCIDASRLLLVSRNPLSGYQSAAYPISSVQRCILPGDYYAVTIDPTLLVDRFSSSSPENIYSVPALPTLPDDKSEVLLYTRELDEVDRMSYDKSMHFSLLAGTEGVSLEKVTPRAESGSRSNWHSASAGSGWATPGSVNSVFTGTVPSGAGIKMSGERITPDADGVDDILSVSFTSPSVQNVISVLIFSENGYPVRTVANNVTTGYEATFAWDGTDDKGALLPAGIYIVWISAFDSAGNVSKWKRAVALLHQ